MKVYIPIGDLTEINTNNLKSITGMDIVLHIQKPITDRATPKKNKRASICKNKLEIIRMAFRNGDEFFVMQDSDVAHIRIGAYLAMLEFITRTKHYGAVAVWPKGVRPENDKGRHVSSQCIMIRTRAIENLTSYTEDQCFCNTIRDYLLDNKWLIKYLNTDIHYTTSVPR